MGNPTPPPATKKLKPSSTVTKPDDTMTKSNPSDTPNFNLVDMDFLQMDDTNEDQLLAQFLNDNEKLLSNVDNPNYTRKFWCSCTCNKSQHTKHSK